MNKWLQIIISLIIVIIFWSVLIGGSPLYIFHLLEKSNILNLHSSSPIKYTDYGNNITLPTEEVIILRMDDVQGYLWSDVSRKLTDVVLEKNMSITLGVIPGRKMDAEIKEYLISKAKDQRIEIAQHGTNHDQDEYLNLSEVDTYNLAKSGFDDIVNILNVYPVTFIPPYNEYNEDTEKALSRLGFKVISAKQDEYDLDRDIAFIGYTVQTKYSDREVLTPADEIIDGCNKSWEHRNVCVITIHPQDYVGEDKRTIDNNKYNKFVELLDELKKLDAKSVTFKDLLR